jgi:antitoxin component of RelBE/YafQ-DinJ toxin-antitoxin module
MSTTTVKLQIPLDKALRDKVEKHARAMGFSSIQDFTRVMYSTVVHKNMQFSLSSPDEERLSPEAEARYKKQLEEHEKDRKAGKVKSYDNVEDFLADLKKL